MILLLVLLAFALFVGLVMEFYKKLIRKDKAGAIENRLVAFALSAILATVYFFVVSDSALPDEIRFSYWLIPALTVVIYILQLPACMALWKPVVRKLLEKKLDD
jgi:FlaA1/EpsC-like NDP-sugar epimerase